MHRCNIYFRQKRETRSACRLHNYSSRSLVSADVNNCYLSPRQRLRMDKNICSTMETSGSAVARSKSSSTPFSSGCKLPEEIEEMIIAKIPFPFIFMSRCLSRRWFYRLSIPYEAWQRNFQKQVTLVSGSWPIFCPPFVVDGTILGYDMGTRKWSRMEMHPFSLTSIVSTSYCQQISVSLLPVLLFGGALLCQILEAKDGCQVIVSNVVTGSTRYLPRPPTSPQARGHIGVIGESRMFHAGSSGYEVLLVHTLINEHAAGNPSYSLFLHLQHYSSETKTWVEKSVFFDPVMPYEQCIYLVKCSPCSDGFIYILFFHERFAHYDHLLEGIEDELEGTMNSSLSLWRYGLYSGQWVNYSIHQNILTDYDTTLADQVSCSIVKCGSRILMVDLKGGNSRTLEGGRWTSGIHVRVCELDGQTEEVEEVSESPLIQVPPFTAMMTMRSVTKFVSDDQHIYICFIKLMELGIQVYRVDDRSWSTIAFPSGAMRNLCRANTLVQSAFSPGLQTFSIV